MKSLVVISQIVGIGLEAIVSYDSYEGKKEGIDPDLQEQNELTFSRKSC